MAEDGESEVHINNANSKKEPFVEGQKSTQRPNRNKQKPKKPCNCRIDELSKPKRWLVLSTWREHGERFEPERMQAMKERVQEEFSMSPEETEMYLALMRRSERKPQIDRLRKAEQRKEIKAAKEAAELFLYTLIKRGLTYAYKNPPPILMSPMLRSISDRVLEQLCDVHDVDIPHRGDSDKKARFLLAAADWTAILTANIYYEVNITEKAELERFEEADRFTYVESETNTMDAGGEPKTDNTKTDNSEQQVEVTDYETTDVEDDVDDRLDVINEEQEGG